MKIATLIARILLGLVFVVFGANNVLHFMKMEPPPGEIGTWTMIMVSHHYMQFVGLIMVVGGLLVLVGRFVPLGLTLLAPILVNIIAFHLLFTAPGIAIGLVCTVLEIYLISVYWRSFLPLLHPNPESKV